MHSVRELWLWRIFVFQQHSEPKHTAKATHKWFQKQQRWRSAAESELRLQANWEFVAGLEMQYDTVVLQIWLRPIYTHLMLHLLKTELICLFYIWINIHYSVEMFSLWHNSLYLLINVKKIYTLTKLCDINWHSILLIILFIDTVHMCLYAVLFWDVFFIFIGLLLM